MNKNILSEVNKMREQMGLNVLSEEQAAKSSIINESVGDGQPFDHKTEGGKQTDAKEGAVNTPAAEKAHTGNGAGDGEPFDHKTEGGKMVNEEQVNTPAEEKSHTGNVGDGQPFDHKTEGGKQTEASEGPVNTPAEEKAHTGNVGDGDPFEKKTEGGKMVNEELDIKEPDFSNEGGEDMMEKSMEESMEKPMEGYMEKSIEESNENMAEIGGVKFNGKNREDAMDENVEVAEELKVLNEAASSQLSAMKNMIKNLG